MIRASAVVLACAGLLGACSSSTKSDATLAVTTTGPAPTTVVTTSPAPSSSTPPATATSAPNGSQPVDATAAIKAAFTTFFDGVNPDIDGKVAVLEHGDQLRQMIVDASANPQFQQLSTVVNSVTAQSAEQCAAAGEVSPCAAVAHDMFVGGLPAMVGLTSHAVEVDGVWKVSAKSWCAIVQIGGATCPTTSG
jgi:hypothetical protein